MKISSERIANLKKRALIMSDIRSFFAERDVLEVETPLIGRSTATDPHIQSLSLSLSNDSNSENHRYLQTSPEFPMKRLLALGSGSIYQISKAFRSGEQGRLHHIEFTMLEWYRVGFDHHDLMQEVDALLQKVLNTPEAEYVTYGELFEQHLGINPHTCTSDALRDCAESQSLSLSSEKTEDRGFWLHLLLSHCIEPQLGQDRPVFVMDFPASQAALAKIREGDIPVAERFEVYYKGIELANGYHELTDHQEQKRRFIADNQQRMAMGLPEIPLDESFLTALESGVPDCAGVALGVDRLVMLSLGEGSIVDVVSFVE